VASRSAEVLRRAKDALLRMTALGIDPGGTLAAKPQLF